MGKYQNERPEEVVYRLVLLLTSAIPFSIVALSLNAFTVNSLRLLSSLSFQFCLRTVSTRTLLPRYAFICCEATVDAALLHFVSWNLLSYQIDALISVAADPQQRRNRSATFLQTITRRTSRTPHSDTPDANMKIPIPTHICSAYHTFETPRYPGLLHKWHHDKAPRQRMPHPVVYRYRRAFHNPRN